MPAHLTAAPHLSTDHNLEASDSVLTSIDELYMKNLAAEIKRVGSSRSDGLGVAEFPSSALTPWREIGNLEKLDFQFLEHYRDRLECRVPRPNSEEIAHEMSKLAKSLSCVLNLRRDALSSLARGELDREHILMLLLECMETKIPSIDAELNEIPEEWEGTFQLFADSVRFYMPKPVKFGFNSLVEKCFQKLATYHKNRSHWKDRTAAPGDRRAWKLEDDLAYVALVRLVNYLQVKPEHGDDIKITFVREKCQKFLRGMSHNDRLASSPDTRLARSQIVEDYTDGILNSLETNETTFEEFRRVFFEKHDPTYIRFREIEVFGGEMDFIEDALKMCEEIKGKENRIAPLRAVELEQDLRSICRPYALYLQGELQKGLPPEEFRSSLLRLFEKVKACRRLATHPKQPPCGEESWNSKTFMEGFYTREKSSLDALKDLLEQVSSDSMMELLSSEKDYSTKSSVRNNGRMFIAMREFDNWTRSCDHHKSKAREIRNIHAESHVPDLMRKWGDIDIYYEANMEGLITINTSLTDVYASTLQDLATDMAAFSPVLYRPVKEESAQSLLRPRSDMLWYSPCVKRMIRAGRQIIKDWQRDDQEMDARTIFEEVGYRIMTDDRTWPQLKLAQLSRLWRIIEMSGSLEKYLTESKWLETWEEMEVVEYAMFDHAKNNDLGTVKEGFEIAKELFYPAKKD